MSTFWPYRWKSVVIEFADKPLNTAVLSPKNQSAFKGRKFGDKTCLQAGEYKPFGRKQADNLALKLIDVSGVITIEPAEQVFFREYVEDNDPDALYLKWLIANFGDVTLTEDIDKGAAAELPEELASVTQTCVICGRDISDKRSGTLTCSPAHRKALSRRDK